jgi:GTP cyclohydrolase I
MEEDVTRTDNSNSTASPASDRIRRRLVAANRRFHANDSIADMIEAGELETASVMGGS